MTSTTWNLPTCGEKVGDQDSSEERASKRARFQPGCAKERLVFRGSLPEADEVMETAASRISWGRQSGAFIYITDSQLLQGFVCGHIPLMDERYEVLIGRIMDSLIDHFVCQRSPPQLWHDPVAWMDRSCNKVADGRTSQWILGDRGRNGSRPAAPAC